MGKGSALLPRGNRDIPGYTPLEAFHPLLHVGNEIAAAHAPTGHFAFVLSTVPPLRRDLTRAPAPAHKLYFLDEMGRESVGNEAYARTCIIKGAHQVSEALARGERTLVHCSFGQNRSTAICICYAILFQGWTAEDAVSYVVQQNRLHRQYYGQSPCSNATFIRILTAISDEQDHRAGGQNSAASAAKKPRTNLLVSWLGLATAPMRRQSAPAASAASAAAVRTHPQGLAPQSLHRSEPAPVASSSVSRDGSFGPMTAGRAELSRNPSVHA